MGKQYSAEEKLKAVQLYEKLGDITRVMTELGYPSPRTLLYVWLKKYREGALEETVHEPKYSEE